MPAREGGKGDTCRGTRSRGARRRSAPDAARDASLLWPTSSTRVFLKVIDSCGVELRKRGLEALVRGVLSLGELVVLRAHLLKPVVQALEVLCGDGLAIDDLVHPLVHRRYRCVRLLKFGDDRGQGDLRGDSRHDLEPTRRSRNASGRLPLSGGGVGRENDCSHQPGQGERDDPLEAHRRGGQSSWRCGLRRWPDVERPAR